MTDFESKAVFVAFVVDVTESKRIKQNLDDMNSELVYLANRISNMMKEIIGGNKSTGSVKFENPDMVYCWKVKKCGREDCPAYNSSKPTRCWQIAGTFCKGQIQGTFAKKLTSCKKCDVYQQAISNPICNLGESFNAMMAILEDRQLKLKNSFEKVQLAQKAAEEANTAKSQFLANMSHELRTPLHGILSFSKFGINKHATAKPEKLLDYFEKIYQSGNTLLNLLNDLLDLAKLEAGKMKFELRPTETSIIILSLVDEFGSLFAERNLTVRHNDRLFKVRTLIDAEKIKQVVRNLVSNAVKFSPEGGNIEIDMQRGDGTVTVSVKDEGPGIPEDELEAVFDKFVQSSKTKSGAGGTGLGLAICHEIITAHNGRIWAQNRAEGGAVFSFEIPTADNIGNSAEPVLSNAGSNLEI